MRINNYLLTGSYPPDICGVGDYTHLLNQKLAHLPIDSEPLKLLVVKDWSIIGFLKTLKKLFNRCNIIHIQYPTEGYGFSIFPMLLFALIYANKRIVTLHEFSQRTLKAKVATSLFFFFSDHLIFTTDFEREYVIKLFPFVRQKSSVINIASNIPSSIHQKPWGERKYDVVYFGHFRPNKGLEDFLQICLNLKKMNRNFKIALIGQLQDRFSEYFNLLALDSNFEIHVNKDDITVSNLLQDSKVLLLPFPDGLTMRRGSFLAGVENDCCVVSFYGNSNDQLEELAYLFPKNFTSKEIADNLFQLLKESKNNLLLSEKYINFKKSINWDSIAQSHLKIYEK